MKVYSSWRSDRVERHGVYVGCTVGTLSDCGGWVDVGTVRHRMGPDWHTTEAAAEAADVRLVDGLQDDAAVFLADDSHGPVFNAELGPDLLGDDDLAFGSEGGGERFVIGIHGILSSYRSSSSASSQSASSPQSNMFKDCSNG